MLALSTILYICYIHIQIHERHKSSAHICPSFPAQKTICYNPERICLYLADPYDIKEKFYDDLKAHTETDIPCANKSVIIGHLNTRAGADWAT